MISKRITGLQCPICKVRLFSWHVHDFRSCFCGAVFVDGGREYLRCGYDPGLDVRTVYWTEEDWKPAWVDKVRVRDSFPY